MHSSTPLAHRTPSRTVLVVEDDRDQRELYSLMLRRGGWKVCVAESGEQAWGLLDDIHPDAIILDVMLPGRDGIGVCRELRGRPHLARVPIMILTALDKPETRARALAAGADAFMTKPVTSTDLNACVQRLTSVS